MKFKIGDKLKASEFDREQYGLKYVTITDINEETKVYYWEEECGDWCKVHSGYFFHEAIPYIEEDISDWDVTLEDGLESVPYVSDDFQIGPNGAYEHIGNQLDLDYQDLLQDILDNGVEKKTRNGSTISVFGRQIRHNMKDGFPLLTTKKMAWKQVVTELLWFLRGDTNIKYLVENDCHIWDGDCFANYVRNFTKYVDSLPEDSETEFIINKDKFINKIKTDDEFAKKWGELGPIYGKQWRRWKGKLVDKSKEFDAHTAWVPEQIDQITNLINDLKTNPDSRRLMVSAWNVGELDQMVLPPCHYSWQVYTRELRLIERIDIAIEKGLTTKTAHLSEEDYWKWCDKRNIPTRAISLMWNQRSVDFGLGAPFNIASYGLLLEIIAKEVNMVPDELIGNLGDVHLYLDHVEPIKEQLNRKPYPLPTLKIEDEVKWKEGDCLPTYSIGDFTLENYQSHPTIKLPLSN